MIRYSQRSNVLIAFRVEIEHVILRPCWTNNEHRGIVFADSYINAQVFVNAGNVIAFACDSFVANATAVSVSFILPLPRAHFRQAVFTFAQIFYIPLYLHRGVSSIIEKKLTAALSHACRSNFNHSDHLFFSSAKLPSRHLHRIYDSPPMTEPRREYDFPWPVWAGKKNGANSRAYGTWPTRGMNYRSDSNRLPRDSGRKRVDGARAMAAFHFFDEDFSEDASEVFTARGSNRKPRLDDAKREAPTNFTVLLKEQAVRRRASCANVWYRLPEGW